MLSRPFVVLYLAVFVAALGISMVSPFLPVYAAQLGATGAWIGLTFSVFAITQTILGPFAGRWSDRFGRRPFIIGGLLIYAVCAVGYLTASNFAQVLAFRALSGVGASLIFSVARAYIGDMVPPGHEGRWFGLFATADIVGFGTGPLLAGVVRVVSGFDAIFVAMALTTLGSALILALLLPAHGAARHTQAAPQLAFGPALHDRLVLVVTLIMAVTALSIGASFSFLAIRLQELGFGPLMTGAAFATQGLASGGVQPLLGRLADRYDRRLLVAVGLGTSAAALCALGSAQAIVLILALQLVVGVGSALTQVTAGAMQVVAGRRAGMGTVIGLGSAGTGAGIVIGAMVGGAFADRFGTGAPFIFGAAAMAAGIVLVAYLTRGVETREPRPGLEATGPATGP